MPRDVNGNYSLTAGQPVVTGTTISSSTHNTLMADIAAELTDSLSRAGKGAMTAALRLFAGTLGAPGVAFNSEPSTGFFLNAVGDLRAAVSGNLIWQATIGEAMRLFGSGIDGATDAGLVVDTLSPITDPTTRLLSVYNDGGSVAYVTSGGAGYFDGAVRVNGAPTLSDHAVRVSDVYAAGSRSSSCGTYTMTGSMADVTNLSVSLTTHGGPVLITLVPESSGTNYAAIHGILSAGTGAMYLQYLRGTTVVGRYMCTRGSDDASASFTIPSSFVCIDTPAAGTYTYKMQAQVSLGSGFLENYQLFAREL